MPGMLDGKSHAELYNLRERAAPEEQGMLAPAEHRAFAREWMQESPVVAGASLPFAIPAYQLSKMLGLQKARTPASLDELFAGYHGMTEGMLSRAVPSAEAQTMPPPRNRAIIAERARRAGEGTFDSSIWNKTRPMREAHGESAQRGLSHLIDIITGRARPSRDPSTWGKPGAPGHGMLEGALNAVVPSAHAHHEQSETVQRPDGKWINVYGQALPQRGQQLPGTPAYDTMEEAERAARSRSEATGFREGVNAARPRQAPENLRNPPRYRDGVRG